MRIKFATVLLGLVFFTNTGSHGAVSYQVALKPPSNDSQNSLDFTVYKNWCKADQEQKDNWQVQLGYCLGYLQGLYWGQVIGSAREERPFCLPSPLSKSAMIDALESYARSHPAQIASLRMTPEETAKSVSEAFKEHFSCH